MEFRIIYTVLDNLTISCSKINLRQVQKLTPLMIYTAQKLIWGQLVSKHVIRVGTWLQTEMAPKYMSIVDAQAMVFGAGSSTATIKFPILHIETNLVSAYHIMPPADESPYFEENEPNRKMEPATAMVSVFRLDGTIRMAEQSDLKTFLSVSKGNFLPMHDVHMTCPVLPAIKGVRAPFALIRQADAIFTQGE